MAGGAAVHVGSRIAAARRRRGLSQKQLAVAIGTSMWEIDRIESGASDSEAHVRRIAGVVGQDEAWLVPSDSVGPVAGPVTAQARRATATLDSTGWVLVIASITLLVTIRFFTEVTPLLPRAANFVDIPIFLVLAVASQLAGAVREERRRCYLPLSLTAITFLCLAVASALVNSTRTAPGPVLVFIYGLLAPLGVFAATYRLWPSGNARRLSRTIFALGFVQLVVVVVVDVPRFVRTRNPDVVSGTFGTNAYQLVFFLLVFLALVMGTASTDPRGRIARLAPVLTTSILTTILLAQYRSLLVSMVVAMAAAAVLLGRRTRGLVIACSTAVGFAIVFHFVAAKLPALKLQSAASSLAGNPAGYATQRLRIFANVSRMYGDLPAAIAIGTGPGTYSSRAWQTFANARSTSHSNVAGSYATGLTHGKSYTTDVSEKYVVPQLRAGLIVQGSRAVSSPYSSYASLLAEVGIGGFALITLAYLRGLGRAWRLARFALSGTPRGDPLPALALAAAIAFLTLVQMAFLENWLEVTRVTFVAWILLAVSAKELDARGRERT